MIRLICSLAMFCMSLFILVMFVGAILLALCLLDYLIDIDIKGKLVSKFGKRTLLKKLRKKVSGIIEKYDTPSTDDLLFVEEDAAMDILTEEESEFLKSIVSENPDSGHIVLTSWSEEKAKEIADILNRSDLYNATSGYENNQIVIKYSKK